MPSTGPAVASLSSDDLIDRYSLELLKAGSDWSFADGDLAQAKDGDIDLPP